MQTKYFKMFSLFITLRWSVFSSMCMAKCIKMSLKNKNVFVPRFQKNTCIPFHSIHLTTSQKSLPHLPEKDKEKADQSSVFPHANKTYLKQTTLAATATFLKLLLQHLWECFFSQLIRVWCLSWSVCSCVKRHNLWSLKPEFYLAWRNTESNEQSMTETCTYLRLKVRRSSLALSRSPTENVALPRKLLCRTRQRRKNTAS